MNASKQPIRLASSRCGLTLTLVTAVLVILRPAPGHAAIAALDDGLDALGRHLTWSSDSGKARARLSGTLDVESYYVDQRPPGLLFKTTDYQPIPRLTLNLETQLGAQWYTLVQARADEGFDPGVEPHGVMRADEYLLRWTPWDDNRLQLQAGKFATVFGAWVRHHDSWSSAFITAPAPYENVLRVTDQSVPPNPAAFLARRIKPDQKDKWLPVLWGPSYATGASVSGSLHGFDYAAEIKNASLSSRPPLWDPFQQDFRSPTVTARIGVRPAPEWDLGISGSRGAYLTGDARPGLPAGRSPGDFPQTTIGTDLEWSRGHLTVRGEAIVCRFEMPVIGNADSLSGYLECAHRFLPGWQWAIRWNQQWFGTVNAGDGSRQTWDHDFQRGDLALSWRPLGHLQLKAQYSYGHRNQALQQGEQLAILQATIRF